jgi:hypothetical protein
VRRQYRFRTARVYRRAAPGAIEKSLPREPVTLGSNRPEAVLDVTEPMGMETLIYFMLDGLEVCGRVNPNAGARDGGPLRLAVDLNNMHLLNEGTGVVL